MVIATNQWIAIAAVSLGISQIALNMKNVYEKDDVSSYSVNYVLAGIVSSTLWLTYQYRIGANYSAAYTSIFLVSQIYILQRLLSKLKTKSPTNWSILTFSSNVIEPVRRIICTMSMHIIYVASYSSIIIQKQIIQTN